MKKDDFRTQIKLMDTGELLKKLAVKYPSPGYAFLAQVRNGTGYLNVTRTADAMVMSLWPSRGLELIGFELKVSRGDWLNELKNPEKAEEMVKYCDRWYVVAPDESVIKPDEVPSSWGLMLATGRGKSIKIIKEAPELKAEKCDRLFLASLMRNITERTISRDLVNVSIDEARKGERDSQKRIRNNLEERIRDHEKAIEDFESISGFRISTWKETNHELANAVKDVVEGRYKKADIAMKGIEKSALKIVKYVRKEIKSYEL